uniref:uncharacterized protein LOC104265663 isoform X2 n=1 Tax=Ciona intestinalis TaxID=7719 RepID=UPI000EF486DE|nr:uncharacterized protein LOC104265663 isoform X2 [Ciona intestinalis]|eukprot:XP_026689922.1 uncharacterized protein LOC104265663 isoform X2 [Ciona intestinalis]
MGQINCCSKAKLELRQENQRPGYMVPYDNREETRPSLVQPQEPTNENATQQHAQPTKPPDARAEPSPTPAKTNDSVGTNSVEEVTRKEIVPPSDDENFDSTNHFNGSMPDSDLQAQGFSFIDEDDPETYNTSHDTFPKDHGSTVDASLESCSSAKVQFMKLQETEKFRAHWFTKMDPPSLTPARRRRRQNSLRHPRNIDDCSQNISMQTLHHPSTE